MKKLLIDVNSIIPYYTKGYVTGVGRSTLELLNAISNIENIPFKIILFSQNLKGIKATNDFPFSYFHLYIPNRPFFKRISKLFRLKKIFCKYDLIHIPHNTDIVENESKVIYTIHDLAVYRFPEMWGVKDDIHFFHKLEESMHKCKAIITCSENSKRDIIKYTGIQGNKIVSIPWGINREIFHPIKERRYINNKGIKDLYYFSASCNHPRKNLPLLLQAYQQYLTEGGIGQLVLLNPMESALEGYRNLIEKEKIIICKGISDKELTELYTNAHCSIVVSQYEGFGFPILESLACHTMVLSANNSSLTEAGGNNIEYFDQLNIECISKMLLKYDKIKKEEMINIEKTEEHLNHFTWENCAKKYIEFYQKQIEI